MDRPLAYRMRPNHLKDVLGQKVLIGDDGFLTNCVKNNKLVSMIQKLLKLRIFEDENGMTNLSLAQKGGSILAVSQFTLYADMRHGNRPSFTSCMKPDEARVLFDYFKKVLKEQYSDCGFGVFQTAMEVTLTNVGPFTILLDSDELGIKGDKII